MRSKTDWEGQVVRGVSPIGKEKAYGGKDLPKSQVLSSEWKTEVVTDSGDGEEGGGDELPCATEGEGGEDAIPRSAAIQPVWVTRLDVE